MPKTITGPAVPVRDPRALAAASWPNSRRRQLPPGHDRELYDSARFLPCYRNGGMYPKKSELLYGPRFAPVANRASRRSSGQVRGRLLGSLPARSALRVKSLEQVGAERAVRLARRQLDLASAR